jgi:hypothetical protein
VAGTCHPVRMSNEPGDDEPTPSTPPPANRRPEYEDFRDPDTQVIDWRAFRAAVAAYDPDNGEAAPSGG